MIRGQSTLFSHTNTHGYRAARILRFDRLVVALALANGIACSDEFIDPLAEPSASRSGAGDSGTWADSEPLESPRSASPKPNSTAIDTPNTPMLGSDHAASGSGATWVPAESGTPGIASVASSYSEFCGDFIRDPELEECDAGPEDALACSAECQVRDFLLVEPPNPTEPSLPSPIGRHPAAAAAQTLAVAFVEDAGSTRVGTQLLDVWGNRQDQIEVSAGASPSSAANPVVAALPGEAFAIAWNDLGIDGSALGIALRRQKHARGEQPRRIEAARLGE